MLALLLALLARADDAHHHHEAAAVAPLAIDSMYQLDVELTDESGAAFSLASLRGHPVLMTMAYTSCTSICPTIVGALQRIEDGLSTAQRKDLRVLLVSLDPVRDTPTRLRTFAASRKLDLERWSLVQPGPDDVREIAAALGVQYRAQPDGEISHSAIVALLDREGRLAARSDGADMDPLIERLAALP